MSLRVCSRLSRSPQLPTLIMSISFGLPRTVICPNQHSTPISNKTSTSLLFESSYLKLQCHEHLDDNIYMTINLDQSHVNAIFPRPWKRRCAHRTDCVISYFQRIWAPPPSRVRRFVPENPEKPRPGGHADREVGKQIRIYGPKSSTCSAPIWHVRLPSLREGPVNSLPCRFWEVKIDVF